MGRIYFIFIFAIFSGYGCKQENPKLSLERIIFHTSSCYGNCSTYHLEVDSNKRIRLFAEKVYRNDTNLWFQEDTTKMGFFLGTVPDSTYIELINELESIGLFDESFCCDASMITIITYYNGKRKYLESMFPPDQADALIGILYDICKTSALERVNEKFNIEQ